MSYRAVRLSGVRAAFGAEDVVRALALAGGLSGPVAEEVCARAGVPGARGKRRS